jgi:hypothetical protein
VPERTLQAIRLLRWLLWLDITSLLWKDDAEVLSERCACEWAGYQQHQVSVTSVGIKCKDKITLVGGTQQRVGFRQKITWTHWTK